MRRTAAALVIGNELLSGKVQDQNVASLATELFALGVELRRVVMCPDEIDTIAAEVASLRAAHDHLVTSGGVGPTHDDVTLEAVARAFGRPLVRSREIAALLRHHYGDRCTESHLRMADVPEGADLLRTDDMPWPTVCVENVVVMPGVPELFRLKLVQLRARLGGAVPFVSVAIHVAIDEGEIAALLRRVAGQHPLVAIGSYPRWGGGGVRVKITFDGRDGDAVERARAAVVGELAPERIVAAEP